MGNLFGKSKHASRVMDHDRAVLVIEMGKYCHSVSYEELITLFYRSSRDIVISYGICKNEWRSRWNATRMWRAA